ncbi:hypothetical protein B6N60_03502 [Richelia sinica FACHB-800]|uniref:Uncharacterized protein n=1 Tax=Richelia sinica FACHB-800 TaxID=1357546 RepID=A0A975Y612_9NOST|nr:hypothetical protein B6N60_03502 [Richelia sinica FACHB-800]
MRLVIPIKISTKQEAGGRLALDLNPEQGKFERDLVSCQRLSF